MNTTNTLTIVRRIVGRRSKITQDDMGAILLTLHDSRDIDLANRYVHDTDDALAASVAWVQTCRGLTCVFILRNGQVRYDQPGSLDPSQHAAITFAPAGMLQSHNSDTYAYLRRHTDRLLIVRQVPEHALIVAQKKAAEVAAEAAKYTKCECDNGHTWRTTDPRRDAQCPVCGEYWV